MTEIMANSHQLLSIVLLLFCMFITAACYIRFVQIAKHKIYVHIKIAKSNILTDAHMN